MLLTNIYLYKLERSSVQESVFMVRILKYRLLLERS